MLQVKVVCLVLFVRGNYFYFVIKGVFNIFVVENWWNEWRAIAYDSLNPDELNIVFSEIWGPVRHILMDKCFKDETYRVIGFTNDYAVWYQQMWLSENFNAWRERIIWYVRRENAAAMMDGLTVLCLYGEVNDQPHSHFVLYGRKDNCRCENIPQEVLLAASTLHSHLDPICCCEFPVAGMHSRALRVHQANNCM